MNPSPDPPDPPSAEDLEDAKDILFVHVPRRVVRPVCACGQDYPCVEVRWANLVKGVG